MAIGEAPEEPAADGANQKAHGIDAGDVQQLRGPIAVGKKAGGEVQRGERVDVEVEPLDQVARRPRGDGGKALAMSERNRHGCAGPRAIPSAIMSSISAAEYPHSLSTARVSAPNAGGGKSSVGATPSNTTG